MKFYLLASVEKQTFNVAELFISKEWPQSQHPSDPFVVCLVSEGEFQTTDYETGARALWERLKHDQHLRPLLARLRP